MSQTAAALVEYLASLPPEVNRYDAAAAAIKASIDPAKGPWWLPRMVIVICALYGVQLIAAIVACVMLVKSADGRFWLFRRGREGVWTPNTQIFYCLLSATFCATDIAALSRQAAIDRGWITSYRNIILLDSLRWLPLYSAAGFFLFGLVAQNVRLHTDATRTLPPASAAAWQDQQRTRGSQWIALLVNALALTWSILFVAPTVVVFILANDSLNKAIEVQIAVCDALQAASPSYDPTTFQMYRLLPLLTPASGMIAPGERFQRLIRIGWILYSFWTSLLIAVFTPFLIKHLSVLRKIGMPAYSIWFWRSEGASQQSASMAGAPLPVLDLGSAKTTSITAAVRTAPPSHDRKLERLSGPKVLSGSHKLAGSLALSSFAVYLAGVVYIPLAIWAAATTLQNENFWIGQLLLGSGSYAIFGLLIHVFVVYRCLIVIRSRHNVVTPGSSSHGKHPVGRRSAKTTEEDSHFVSRGVWIETYVDVKEDQEAHSEGRQHAGRVMNAPSGPGQPWKAPWDLPWDAPIPISMPRTDSGEMEKTGLAI